MSIRLRRSLRREPTLKEVLDLAAKCEKSPQTYETVSREQVKRALEKGEEVRKVASLHHEAQLTASQLQGLTIFGVECVGYDEEFVQELAEKFHTWIPKRLRGDAAQTPQTPVPAVTREGRKRKRTVKVESDDEESAMDIDNLPDLDAREAVSYGTKSRPRKQATRA